MTFERYDIDREYDCGQFCMSGMCEYPDGKWVRYEDAKAAQAQLREEIKEIISKFKFINGDYVGGFYEAEISQVAELRQLAAREE